MATKVSSLGLIIFSSFVIACSGNTSESTKTSQSLESGKDSSIFSKADYGEAWPLRGIDQGKIECIDGMYIVFVTESGTYALNGTARSVAKDKTGWIQKSSTYQVRVLAHC